MVSRSWVIDRLASAPVTRGTPAFGWSRTTRKIGIANTANSTPATKKIGIGALGDAQQEQRDGGEDRAQ